MIDVDPLLKKWYDSLGYFLLEGEGEAYVDGAWRVAHVGPTAERQAAAGIPITRFGEDSLGIWFFAQPGTIMRLESLPLGLAAGSRALHTISPGSMERVNISVLKQIEKGREIMAQAGGVRAYDEHVQADQRTDHLQARRRSHERGCSSDRNESTPWQRSGMRSRGYLVYLIVLMGLVAMMDQYLSTVKTTAIPYLLEEYGITAARFSWLEALYLISSFFIFALNGLNDIIGRKRAMLVLILMMGLSALGIVLWTPSLHLFMVFYAVVMFTTVSNMWSISISEESVAEKRAKNVAIVYVIGLIPLQALLPPLLIDTLGLDWKWMYGVMFLFMIPVLVMWFFMKETDRYETIRERAARGHAQAAFLGLGVIDRRDVRYIIISASVWFCCWSFRCSITGPAITL